MSCVLRITTSNPRTDWSKVVLQPYRVEGHTAHFDVSERDFDDFMGQVNDAISFLSSNGIFVSALMSEADGGVLDFAVEWRNLAAQNETFPSELVRIAGSLGLALELSHYRVSDQ